MRSFLLPVPLLRMRGSPNKTSIYLYDPSFALFHGGLYLLLPTYPELLLLHPFARFQAFAAIYLFNILVVLFHCILMRVNPIISIQCVTIKQTALTQLLFNSNLKKATCFDSTRQLSAGFMFQKYVNINIFSFFFYLFLKREA